VNKLLGFYELKSSSLPTIPWEEYKGDFEFANNLLWTIRTAVFKGADFNLPRHVGVPGKEAKCAADSLYNRFANKGLVIYYPYFIAEKSGTLNVNQESIVIEAVKEDLWNLVTYSSREVTIIYDLRNDTCEVNGNKEFLIKDELDIILKYVPAIRGMFRDYINSGDGILLEWSFAYNCDINKNKLGEKYFVFYEARTI